MNGAGDGRTESIERGKEVWMWKGDEVEREGAPGGGGNACSEVSPR